MARARQAGGNLDAAARRRPRGVGTARPPALLAACLAACIACVPSALRRPSRAGPLAATFAGDIAPWKRDVVYQVFPRTFRDASGDGVGDLAGVVEKVPYLESLGVNVVWLNPIYPSGGVDSGYDVVDFLAIDPAFGDMADFVRLKDALHARGMRLMMDLVLNHTSDRHPWFLAELGRKALQRRVRDILATAGADEGEVLLGLLADPASAAEATGANVAAVQEAVATYLARDDRAAEASGYPGHEEGMRAIAEHLRACLGHAECKVAAMPFDDFYLWLDAPNNWHSLFGGPAWRPEPEADAVCMHFFSTGQLDLNWRNPRVREAMGEMARVWQERGVDAFRLDSIITLAKDPRFPPDLSGGDCPGVPFFTNLPEIHRYIRRFTEGLKSDTVTIGEASFSPQDAALRFARLGSHELSEVFVFDHVTLDGEHGTKWRQIPLDVARFKRLLREQQQLIHGKAWLGNYLENHDQLRMVSRFGDAEHFPGASAQALAALLLTLEGTPFIYQGQELGMTDLPAGTFTRVEDIEDVEARGWYRDRVAAGEDPKTVLATVARRCRDNVRSAMQWSAGAHAGFTEHETHVRVHPNHARLNVEAEVKDPASTWHAYRRLIELRRARDEWVVGDFTDLAPEHPKVFAYRRRHGNVGSWVLINLSSAQERLELPAAALPGERGARLLWSNEAEPPTLAATVELMPWAAAVWGGEG